MARVNVYLPDELAAEARRAGLNISGVLQDALRREMSKRDVHQWLDRVSSRPPVNLDRETVLRAIDEGRDELGL